MGRRDGTGTPTFLRNEPNRTAGEPHACWRVRDGHDGRRACARRSPRRGRDSMVDEPQCRVAVRRPLPKAQLHWMDVVPLKTQASYPTVPV